MALLAPSRTNMTRCCEFFGNFRKTISRSLNGFSDRILRVHFIRYLPLVVVWLMAATAYGHYGGRTLPIGYSGEGSGHLAAQVVASYFEEQMARGTKLVEKGSPAECLQSIRDREFPMAVIPAAAAEDLPKGVVKLEGMLGAPGRTVVFVIGSDARKKLEFSLFPAYLDRLSKGLTPAEWEEALTSVEAGKGIKGVALDMLRRADLL